MTTANSQWKWIGLRDSVEGVLLPEGLVPAATNRAETTPPHLPLPTGTIRVEYRTAPEPVPHNILRFSRRDPFALVFTLRANPDGSLSLLLRRGAEDRLLSLALPPSPAGAAMAIQFGWDASQGSCYLWAEIPSIGAAAIQTLDAPMGFSQDELRSLMTDPQQTSTGDGFLFAAVADGAAPAGPLPCLDGTGLVELEDGKYAPLCTLNAGERIVAADGGLAQVRWIGSADVVSIGRMSPYVIKPPYYQAAREIIAAGAARLRLDGANVEYLFGDPEVAVRLRHLADSVAVIPMSHSGTHTPGYKAPMVIRYYQVLLDRAVPLRLSGIRFDALDLSGLIDTPDLLARSVLGGTPPELLARPETAPCRVLREFEAQTLRQMQAA